MDKHPEEAEYTSGDEASDEDEPENDDVDDEGFSRLDHITICISFSGLAMLLHSFFSVVISGSQDILGGTYIPTTTILASHVSTMVIVTSILPWCMQKIPYLWRTLIVFAAMASGTVLIILVDNVYVKIIGVSLNALAHGLGEISFLALSAFYGKFSLTSFAAGSGAGILLGPIYYTGMTSWLCVSPQISLTVIAPTTLLILLFYYLLDKDRIKPYAFLEKYKNLKSTDSECSDDYLDKEPFGHLSWGEKCTAACQIFPLMIALCSAYIAEYITIHAVFTTIAFEGAPFAPRDHFVYYVLVSGVGEFLFRSYLSVIAWFKPVLIRRLVVKHTWIFSLILLAFMSLAVCASFYRIFNSVWSVLLFCFIIGSVSGFVFANTVCAVPLIVEPKYKEFCLGLVTIGESAGVLIASLAGLAVEPALRKHCTHIVKKTALCYTRPTTNRWSASVCSIKGWGSC